MGFCVAALRRRNTWREKGKQSKGDVTQWNSRVSYGKPRGFGWTRACDSGSEYTDTVQGFHKKLHLCYHIPTVCKVRAFVWRSGQRRANDVGPSYSKRQSTSSEGKQMTLAQFSFASLVTDGFNLILNTTITNVFQLKLVQYWHRCKWSKYDKDSRFISIQYDPRGLLLGPLLQASIIVFAFNFARYRKRHKIKRTILRPFTFNLYLKIHQPLLNQRETSFSFTCIFIDSCVLLFR